MCRLTWKQIEYRLVEDGDCLLWNSSVDVRGFPRVNVKEGRKNKTLQVRRVVWELKKGPVPDGMKVTNTCGNRLCVAHLDVVTHGESIAKAANTPHSIAKRVANGAKGGRMNAKLDMGKARYIRQSEKTASELAKELGVSTKQVTKVRRGLNWKDHSNPFAGLMS